MIPAWTIQHVSVQTVSNFGSSNVVAVKQECFPPSQLELLCVCHSSQSACRCQCKDFLAKPSTTFPNPAEFLWRPRKEHLEERSENIVLRRRRDGKILEVTIEKPLATTLRTRWDAKVLKDEPSKVTWDLTFMGDVTTIKLVHDGFAEETPNLQTVDRWLEHRFFPQ